jgi:hypothetical protein
MDGKGIQGAWTLIVTQFTSSLKSQICLMVLPLQQCSSVVETLMA